MNCQRCGYVTEYKYNLRAHLEKKKVCKPLLKDIDRNLLIDELYPKKEHICICGKMYTLPQGLYRHRKKCTKSKEYSLEMKELKKDFDNKLIELENKFINAMNSTNQNNTTINTNSHNTTNNVTNNINNINNSINNNINLTIRSYGDENKEYISEEILESILIRKPTYGLIELIEKIHFNPNYPENHNIKLINFKDKVIHIFRDGEWNLEDKNNMLMNLIEENYQILIDYFEENPEKFAKYRTRKLDTINEAKGLIKTDTQVQLKTLSMT